MDVPALVWGLTIAGLAGLLLFDFFFHVRRAHAPTLPEAARWTGLYVSIALLFGVGVWIVGGADMGTATPSMSSVLASMGRPTGSPVGTRHSRTVGHGTPRAGPPGPRPPGRRRSGRPRVARPGRRGARRRRRGTRSARIPGAALALPQAPRFPSPAPGAARWPSGGPRSEAAGVRSLAQS